VLESGERKSELTRLMLWGGPRMEDLALAHVESLNGNERLLATNLDELIEREGGVLEYAVLDCPSSKIL
jgi:hypothetical protein